MRAVDTNVLARLITRDDPRHSHMTIQDADVVAAALEQYRGNPHVNFFDYLVLEVARKAGYLPLGTFDRRLARVSGALRI
jgi:predicted nucleic-acid-binding protein